MSLTDTSATIVIIAALALAVLAAAWGLRTRPRATLISAAFAAVVGLLSWLVLAIWWNPWPGEIPGVFYPAAACIVFVLACLVSQRGRRRLMAVASIVALLSGAGIFNLVFQVNPTIGSFDNAPVVVPMSYADFQQTTAAPRSKSGEDLGALVTVPFAGTTSEFPARDAMAYVPPGYWTHPEVALPVVVLMPGTPGQPDQWFTSGQADQAAADFAAGHDGVAPIVISVDATASFTGNPVCADGPEFKVLTYVSKDVPELIRSHFRVSTDQSTWTIGGLSYGGTCALQVVTNHPEAYGSFLNFSGEAEPTTGKHDDTVNRFFDGSEEAFQAENPATLLTDAAQNHDPKYSHIAGKFISGERDKEARSAQENLSNLAQAAGMDTTVGTVPGGHTFQVWRVAIADTLSWAAERGGIQ